MRILIVGNISEDYHLGSVFLRASREIGIEAKVIDTSFSAYSPSMRTIPGRIFFKISGKRPCEWWSLNKTIVQTITKFRPFFLLVTGIIPLSKEVFRCCQDTGARIVNFLTDYPWNPIHKCPTFTKYLRCYDVVASTKSSIVESLSENGVQRCRFLPFAFDPALHYSENERGSELDPSEYADVLFVGTADAERLPYFDALTCDDSIKLKVCGPGWAKIMGQLTVCEPIYGSTFRDKIRNSKINLGLVRKANKDQSTMRSFEIPACGGLGIYEDTAEHRDIFAGYPEQGFFSGPDDLARKCKLLLADPAKREEMRQLGMRLVRHEGNTYSARLRTMIEWARE